MSIRRSRRNVSRVLYNARKAAVVSPPPTKGRLKIVDSDDDSGDSEDEFPEEQDSRSDVDLLVDDDEDLDDDIDDDLEEDLEEEDEEEDSEHDNPPRKRARTYKPRKIPKAMYPEDVAWKPLNTAPKPDPEELRYHPSIGWLVMFVSTFGAVFNDLGGYGPQDIEEGVVEPNVSIHKLFARLLGLVLNRKKEIEYKRYVSALQELHSQLPLLGGTYRLSQDFQWKSQDVFELLKPIERLEILQLLALWALTNSKTLHQHMSKLGSDSIICYTGFDDELNRYYFCKGAVGDTRFRLYRETNPYVSVVNWTPVASNCDELEKFTRQLDEQTGDLSQSLVQILDEFLPIARESEDRRIKEEKRVRRHNQIAREVALVRSEPRESRRTRAPRVNYSMLAYDEEIERATRKRERAAATNDREWGSPAPDLGSRQSRRLRGGIPDQEKTLEQVEAEFQIKRAKELAEKRAKRETGGESYDTEEKPAPQPLEEVPMGVSARVPVCAAVQLPANVNAVDKLGMETPAVSPGTIEPATVVVPDHLETVHKPTEPGLNTATGQNFST